MPITTMNALISPPPFHFLFFFFFSFLKSDKLACHFKRSKGVVALFEDYPNRIPRDETPGFSVTHINEILCITHPASHKGHPTRSYSLRRLAFARFIERFRTKRKSELAKGFGVERALQTDNLKSFYGQSFGNE